MGMCFTMWMRKQIRFSVRFVSRAMLYHRLLVCMQVCTFCCCVFAQLQTAHAAIKPIDSEAYTIYYKNRAPNAHGEFHLEFQTSNGITTKAAGNEFGHSGVVQYVSPEGIPITETYVADANGYHPTGDHIPKLPEQVLLELLKNPVTFNTQRQQRTVNEKKNNYTINTNSTNKH